MMKFNPSIPIYIQIMDSIKKEILSGAMASGEKLESVRALASRFGVNLNTMQRACSELEREGVINTQRGIGSFVTKDQVTLDLLKEEMTYQKVDGFLEEMRSAGLSDEEIVNIVKKAIQK